MFDVPSFVSFLLDMGIPMDQHNQLLTEENDNILTLILNRPEKRNALTPEMLVQLYQVLMMHASKDRIRVVVLRGAGDRAFSSGYDIHAIPTGVSPEVEKLLQKKSPFELAVESIVDFPYPVIAMLNGFAFGGACDLAVACDMRIAADHVQMGMVPARLGMVYFPEGLQRFVRTIGLPRTKEMFFTARRYDTNRLKEMGLVDYVLPRNELADFTYALAGEIAANAPLSLRGIKRILNLISATGRLDASQQTEARKLVRASLESADLKEGQAAFLQKRRPRFNNT
jgi:enoyl-CoA hydratase/carnithine racemase